MKTKKLPIDFWSKPAKVVEGIYFSERTGRIFEAKKKYNNVHIKFTDGSEGMTIVSYIFNIQCDFLGVYELLIPYED